MFTKRGYPAPSDRPEARSINRCMFNVGPASSNNEPTLVERLEFAGLHANTGPVFLAALLRRLLSSCPAASAITSREIGTN